MTHAIDLDHLVRTSESEAATEVAGEETGRLPHVSTGKRLSACTGSTIEELADLARRAIGDDRARKSNANSTAGATAWKSREPKLAAGILAITDAPLRSGGMTSIRAMHAGEVRLLQEEIVRLHGEIRELRFERDRMRLAYLASYELATKIAAECADPERIEQHIADRLKELEPTINEPQCVDEGTMR